MQFQQLNDRLDTLELKARQLAVRLRHVQGMNEELQALNNQLNRELEKANERIRQLEAAAGSSQAGTTALVADAREIRNEIQRYIDELDKCIDWLGKQA